MFSSHVCCVRRYTIHHQYQYTIAKYAIRLGSTLPKYTLLECTWYLVSLVGAEPDKKWVDRGLITSRHRMLSSHGCCARRYTIHHQYIIAKYKIRLGSSLPKDILLECTWYLVSLVEAEPDTKCVDRGLIIFRHRMLSSNGCCVRRYTIHHQNTILPGIRYDLAQLYQKITYLNVPGTWYLSWKRSPTRNGLTVG